MKWHATKDGGKTTVTLSGKLDESVRTDFLELRTELSGLSHATIDVGGITLINSLGIFHWIEFTRQLDGRVALAFASCRDVFLDYVLMIRSLATGKAIATFYAPFACKGCDRTLEVLVARAQADTALVARACDECGPDQMRPTPLTEELVQFLAECD